MPRFRFRRDTAVWTADDVEIALMILQRHTWGITYLGRKRNPRGKGYLYAMAGFHDTGGRRQFVSGNTFANGFTGGAFEYVATWKASVPAKARRLAVSAKIEDHIDTGLWAEVGNGVIASAWWDLDLDHQYRLNFHRGQMPAHHSETFESLDALEAAMRKAEPDLRRWHTRMV